MFNSNYNDAFKNKVKTKTKEKLLSDEKFKEDYLKVAYYKLGKSNDTIENINEILLSKNYYNSYGEYGVDNFLKFYREKFGQVVGIKNNNNRMKI